MIVPEFLAQGPSVGQEFLHFGPEYRGVVFDPGVKEFVEQDVVDQLGGQVDEMCVEGDIVFVGATTPAGPLLTDREPVVGEVVLPGELIETGGEKTARLEPLQGLQGPWLNGRGGRTCGYPLQVFADPGNFGGEKLLCGFSRDVSWEGDPDGCIGLDCDGKSFGPAGRIEENLTAEFGNGCSV